MNTKPRLEGCERADHTSPGLKRDHCNGYEVRSPEPSCVDPTPAPHIADHDKYQPADDEHDDGSMQNEDQICKGLVHGGLRL